MKGNPPAEAPEQPLNIDPLEGGAYSELHGNSVTHGVEAVLVGGVVDLDALSLRGDISVLSCQHQDVARTFMVQFQRSGLIVILTVVLVHAGNTSKLVVYVNPYESQLYVNCDKSIITFVINTRRNLETKN